MKKRLLSLILAALMAAGCLAPLEAFAVEEGALEPMEEPTALETVEVEVEEPETVEAEVEEPETVEAEVAEPETVEAEVEEPEIGETAIEEPETVEAEIEEPETVEAEIEEPETVEAEIEEPEIGETAIEEPETVEDEIEVEAEVEEIVAFDRADAAEIDTISDVTAVAVGDRMIRLTWSYTPPEGMALSDYRYLIYRSESESGDFTRIGYTSLNSMTYTDAGGNMYDGGAGGLTAGTTYYYKIQAYSSSSSSNLTYASVASAVPAIQTRPVNEFVLETEKDQAVAYLRSRMVARDTTVTLDIWLDADQISGYSAVLFNETIVEDEDVTKYNEGDYLWYHLFGGGYDCDLFDPRIVRNGLNKYTLTYTFSYYTTAAQEAAVEAKVDEVIAGFGFTSETTDAEKVQAVYEWLSEGAAYDLSTIGGKSRCSAYDAIINKRAVCQGYSNATYIFLRKLGILNRIMDGSVIYDGASRPHAWNLVEIDGKWYNVCVTTEVHMREGYGSLSYRYLLKADDYEYFSIFERGAVAARGIDYDGASFRGAHPVTESYDLGLDEPTVPADTSTITDLTATAVGNMTVRLDWTYTPPEGDSLSDYQYLIYRSTSKSGEYEKIGYTRVNTLTYTDAADLTEGTTYYYKVQAYYAALDKSSNLYYANVASATVFIAPEGIESLTVAPKSGVTMTLSWSAVSGANSYEVWYSTTGTNYEKVKTTGEGQTTASHTGLTAGTRYWYKIYAVDESGAVIASSAAKEAVALATPVLNALETTAQGLSLTWSKASGADRYNIYRSTSANGTYTYLQSVQKVESYVDTTAQAGTTYYYKVRAYKKLDGIVYYGGYSAYRGLAMNSLTVTPKSGVTMTLSWSAVGGANSYEVWYSTTGTNYEYVKTTGESQTTASHTGLTAGTRYWYRVLAKDKNGTVIGMSEVKAAVALATPVLNAPETTAQGVSLTWSKASGADRYNIYRSTSANGTYTYLQSVQKVESCVDTTARAGTTYYYKVRAYKKLDDIVYYGGYSVYQSITLKSVSGFTVTPKSGVTMTLSWGAVSGVYSYEVWHSAAGTDFELVKTTGSSQTGTSHTGLTAGTRHWYRILAKDKSGTVIGMSEIKAAVALATPVLNEPTTGIDGVNLTWSKASGADRYNIYRSTSPDGTYTYITSVQKVESYVDITVTSGTTYYYKVRAYKKLDDIVYYGGDSNSMAVTFQ